MPMGSFNSSHLQQQVPPDPQDPLQQDHHHQNHPHRTIPSSDLQLFHHPHQISSQQPLLLPRPPIPAIQLRQLLIRCAELVSQRDFLSAAPLISFLSSNSSPLGDSTERLTHHFVRALRLNNPALAVATGSTSLSVPAVSAGLPSSSSSSYRYYSLDEEEGSEIAAEEEEEEEAAVQSCYLTLNQITPFIRFSHLTANQAILEAIDSSHNSIHIVDFDIMHGVQWPPLMQALAERFYNNNNNPNNHHSPPTLRITATGNSLPLLLRTGDRLQSFADSLGLHFRFHPIVLNSATAAAKPYDVITPQTLGLLPDEALAVNCVLFLHTLVTDDSRDLILFLQRIKSLNPKVLTVANVEAGHNHPVFFDRFVEALDHYGAVFDSLEATLPPNSRERIAVEKVWLGREIREVVGTAEGMERRRQRLRRRQRHERYASYWEVVLRRCGFENVALSGFALSQAKLLLRIHYPSEGYQLRILSGSFFLGWQNRSLFSVSSWH